MTIKVKTKQIDFIATDNSDSKINYNIEEIKKLIMEVSAQSQILIKINNEAK